MFKKRERLTRSGAGQKKLPTFFCWTLLQLVVASRPTETNLFLNRPTTENNKSLSQPPSPSESLLSTLCILLSNHWRTKVPLQERPKKVQINTTTNKCGSKNYKEQHPSNGCFQKNLSICSWYKTWNRCINGSQNVY